MTRRRQSPRQQKPIRTAGTFHAGSLKTQSTLSNVSTNPVIQTVQKTVETYALEVVDVPVAMQRQNLAIQTVQTTVEEPRIQEDRITGPEGDFVPDREAKRLVAATT